MSPTTFDPRAFGRLEQSVDHLTKSVEALTSAVSELTERVSEIDGRYKYGKGAVAGLLAAGTLAVYGGAELFDKLTGMFLK